MTDMAQRVNNIEGIALSLDKKVTLIDDRQQKNIKDVEELDEAIHGNGKPGLCKDVVLLTAAIAVLSEFMKDVKKLGWGILITCIGIIISLLANLILNHGYLLAR